MKNPLRLDPSRTALLRRSFTADLSRRFKRLQKEVWSAVGTHDMLGLDRPTVNAPDFQFDTDDKKLSGFNEWIQDQINAGILEAVPGDSLKNLKPWLYTYIDSAYKKGAIRSYVETKKPTLGLPAGFSEGSKAQFLYSAFSRPERVSKLRLLYTRSYENLKGVTGTMAGQMSRVLADGIAHGKGPHEVAKTLSQTITGISRQRAKVLARTEIIHAHAEGQLDGFEDLGVEEVGAQVEFTTSDDDGVCPECEELEGEIFTIDEARGVIPVHPACRCAWAPVVDLSDL